MQLVAQLPGYAAGSDGPPEANALLARNGHKWGAIGESRNYCDV